VLIAIAGARVCAKSFWAFEFDMSWWSYTFPVSVVAAASLDYHSWIQAEGSKARCSAPPARALSGRAQPAAARRASRSSSWPSRLR
jgi:hypothetical protein